MKRPESILLLLVALAATLVSACEDAPTLTTVEITDDHSDIQDPLERWQAYGIDSYRVGQGMGCFCPEPTGWIAFIENGQVVDVEVDTDGVSDPESYRERARARAFTVERAFSIAREAAERADSYTVEYDERFGYPRYLAIDWVEGMLHEEMTYTLGDIRRLVRN